ncbi:alpha-xylosidase [Pseudoclavibacter sp. RFBA6]|uniref:alpha-xylosidase n=1 Tax=Pseudoclavibacter sp. RFBA6 TaxID=2080573 RepID=UPI000CE85817|nr:alpha-xylosidase [Pseudoclavibacter sp. RFBA6]PPG38263.1 alpha-xylosidase [Pseudoclavibacter sp. RFBA6]
MKFTDGFWQIRPGVEVLYAQEVYDLEQSSDGQGLQITAPTKVIGSRGDTLNRPILTVSIHSPLPDVIGVTIEHHQGGKPPLGFSLPGATSGHAQISVDETEGTLRSGSLTLRAARGEPWSLSFESGGRVLTSSGHRSVGYAGLQADAQVDAGVVGSPRSGMALPLAEHYVHEQLSLEVGELIYGLGERFGPLVKNGQNVEVWNADGGTSSEQAYKNVPFYLSDRGYGVLVDNAGHVSFEVGSEAVERVQFSVPGERLTYYVIGGGSPEAVLDRYTQLTGRPAKVPAWSYGLWLSTSFTTDYEETTVTEFIDAMAERELPLSVFHFDCFWMREFNWSDFTWDARTFPEPERMLARLHAKDLRVSVWINPYIGQRSHLFAEAKELGYLVRKPNGDVWQWDKWQAGMALVDFTNAEATAWYQGKLRALIDQGVDCFKTDFGERIPVDVVYADGSDPVGMHNSYTQRYNEAVFEVLEGARGEGDAVLFARSATVGGQRLPVHWGGDSTSSYVSMAETLRGGLSLALSGFGFWSHDIGGFEGTPDAGVFKRWVAFGLLSSHSRLHGSSSYRVPWVFDEAEGLDESDPQSAVSVLRKFSRLKLQLMPYLYAAGLEAHERGIPMLRPMVLAFPDDPSCRYLDRQYLLGEHLLVAPVFSADEDVEFYLPAGRWTSLLEGTTVQGGTWRRERHGFDSLPLYVREGAVIARHERFDRPDHDYLDGVVISAYPGAGAGSAATTVTTPDGASAEFVVSWGDDSVSATGPTTSAWSLQLGDIRVNADGAAARIER